MIELRASILPLLAVTNLTAVELIITLPNYRIDDILEELLLLEKENIIKQIIPKGKLRGYYVIV